MRYLWPNFVHELPDGIRYLLLNTEVRTTGKDSFVPALASVVFHAENYSVND